MSGLPKHQQEQCREAFDKAGYWPNEVMWKAWQQAWEAALSTQSPSTPATGETPLGMPQPINLGDVSPYLKDGESVAECIARNRKDTDIVLGQLAKEKFKSERLARELAEANDQRADSRKMIEGLCELRDELKAKLAAQSSATPAPCEWLQDDDGIYHSFCGDAFTFFDGGPKENSMKFCCYCGGKLVTPSTERKEP